MLAREMDALTKKQSDINELINKNITKINTPDVKRIENCLNLCYLKISKIIEEAK